MMWNGAGLRQRLSEGGRRRIQEKFNWRKAAEETLAVYEEIVPAKRRSMLVSTPLSSNGAQQTADSEQQIV
jgi:hypothetical protein